MQAYLNKYGKGQFVEKAEAMLGSLRRQNPALMSDSSASENTGKQLLPFPVDFEPEGGEPAELIMQGEQSFSGESLNNHGYGWFTINFTVDEKGEVKLPKIVDGVGNIALRNESLHMVQNSQYKPALSGETFVESLSSTKISWFFEESDLRQVSKDVRDKLKLTLTDIASSNFIAVERHLKDIDISKSTLADFAWYYLLKGKYLKEKQDWKSAEISFRRLKILQNNEVIPNVAYIKAMSDYYLVLVKSGKYGNAVRLLQDLDLGKGTDSHELDRFRQHASEIEEKISSISTFTTSYVELSSYGWANHDLIKSAFSISTHSGSLDQLIFSCDGKKKRYKFKPDLLFTLPEGQCSFEVYGDVGSVIDIIEVDNY